MLRKGGSTIEDEKIIALLFERSEEGLEACKTRYGAYIYNILYNILRSREDSDECFNDTLLAVWNTIPPAKPESLRSYVGALARNIGINLYTKNHRQKRGGQTEELMEELVSLSGEDDPEGELLAKELSKKINGFLATLDKSTRICFVMRYYYGDPIEEIAEKTGKNKHAVVALLSKTRARLKAYLAENGEEF